MLILGFITPNEAIEGFSNPAVLVIGCLFILSHALQKSGVLEYFVVKINRLVQHSLSLGLTVYLLSIALASAVVNNTAIVAIFMPVSIRLAGRYKLSPSKVLIPLSYAAIFGGTLTLVGTSTNLIVNAVFLSSGGNEPLGMFEFAKFGWINVIVGLAYLTWVAPKLLPSRTVTSSLTKNYHMGGYLTEMMIIKDSPLVGKSCLERGLNQNYDVMVLDIQRDEKLITSNIRNTKLQEGDVLFVRGSLENFLRMKEVEKINLLTDEKLTQKELEQEDNILIECILTDRSDLVGRSLMELNFRRKFGSFVLAVRREGALIRKKIAHLVLHSFDALLVYGPKDKIHAMGQSGDIIVLEEYDTSLQKKKLWWVTSLVILVVILSAAFGFVPILKGVILGVVCLFVLRIITPNEAYQAIHWQVIVMIAALIPLGKVMQSTGTAAWIGSSVIDMVHLVPLDYQPIFLLALIYLITMILTEISSNAATAIIMAPIAMAITANMGLEARPYIFAVCFAASASFITPVGYQTNLMVYGPGGYKFSDYMRVGFPLAITLWLLATLVIPKIWPLVAL
jgi:di/tricarboxylate transporter